MKQPKLLAVVALYFLNTAVAADLFVTVAPVSELQNRITTEFPASGASGNESFVIGTIRRNYSY